MPLNIDLTQAAAPLTIAAAPIALLAIAATLWLIRTPLTAMMTASADTGVALDCRILGLLRVQANPSTPPTPTPPSEAAADPPP